MIYSQEDIFYVECVRHIASKSIRKSSIQKVKVLFMFTKEIHNVTSKLNMKMIGLQY
jgi:hypothetical protein